MRILNYGSLNIDHVYQLDHIVRPGETLASSSTSLYAGGKGANQSCALGKAGAKVFHAGKIGKDGQWLLERLQKSGVDTSNVTVGEQPTGHAIIQVDTNGENAIFLFGGGNTSILREEIDRTLENFSSGDILLLQNEINEMPYIIESAHKRGLKICFNPAPYTPEVAEYPLDKVDMLIVNETEGKDLSGCSDENEAVRKLMEEYPDSSIVMTLGSRGVRYCSEDTDCTIPGLKAEVVDTTAAGDTFIGYMLAGIGEGMEIKEALELGCRAAAITVSRPGAGDSIPLRAELEAVL